VVGDIKYGNRGRHRPAERRGKRDFGPDVLVALPHPQGRLAVAVSFQLYTIKYAFMQIVVSFLIFVICLEVCSQFQSGTVGGGNGDERRLGGGG
jgi:hypothetical protein